MNRGKKGFVVFLIVAILFVQGCASTDKRLALNELQTIDSLKVVRHETPKFLKTTAGSTAIVLTGIMFGAVGGALGGALSYAAEAKGGSDLIKTCNLPDFGELVFNKFIDRVPREMPNWPRMEIEKKPIEEDFNFVSGHLLVLDVALVKIAGGTGFVTSTTARIVDSKQNMLWQRKMSYESREFNRSTTLGELEADNGKLLREEFDFAAEKTISDFVSHLKGMSTDGKELAKSDTGK